MGLDIYHLKANAEGRGSPWVLDEAHGKERMQEKFEWCLREVDFPVTDWSKTLAPLGFDVTQYDLTIGMPVEGHTQTGQPARAVGFRRRSGADTRLPERLFVTNADAPESVAARFHKGWGANAVVLRAEDVPALQRAASVFAEEIGYQQNAVAAALYQEFQPGEWIVDFARVRRIHELTDEDERDAFRAAFLDPWDDRTSFVFVGW